MTRSWLARAALVGCCASVGFSQVARAQSLTAGEVSGTVRDPARSIIGGALITLTDQVTGLVRHATATRSGRFHLALVAPGEYQVLVEQLGYRAVRVLGVLVRPGAAVDVPVRLVPASPPLSAVDTVSTPASAGGGAGEWFSPIALRHLPDRSGGLAELGRLSTTSDSDLATEGLPNSLSGFLLDGALYRPARHPGLAGGQFDAGTLGLAAFDGAELVANGADVEWAGIGGATLSGFTRSGAPRLEPHLSVDWSGNALSSSKYFNTGALANSSLRGALQVSGPVVRDSAQFTLGIEGQRLERPMPAAWATGAAVDSIALVAQDTFKTPLGSYQTPHLATTDIFAAFGGVTWQPSAGTMLGVNARYATTTTTSPDLGAGPAPSLGTTLDTRDFFAGATFGSTASEDVSQELRLGVESSIRGYVASTPTASMFTDIGAPVGSDPAFPGHFQRTGGRATETLHYQVGPHRMKFGASVAVNSYDQTYGFGSTGIFDFSGAADFAQRRGVFVESTPVSPETQFTTTEFGVFAQDLVTAAPGIDFLLGLRYDREGLPQGKAVANQAWLKASGLDNSQFKSALDKVSPRAQFVWDVGQQHTTEVRGAAGVYFDQFDAGALADVISQSLGDTVRRGVGVLGAWPKAPDLAHAPTAGSELTLLAQDIQAPRTGRVGLGLWRSLGAGVALQLAGTYSHTDFLLRRHDLNLRSAPSAHDQYGRPVYGTLVQEGDLVTVQPGTNRRFAGFDMVSALNPDGYSDYWGFTASVERQVGDGLHLLASYTYSKTTDNWLSARTGDPVGQLSPFPDSLGGQDWAKGRSDLDVPHRVAIAAELATRLPLAPRFAVVYRFRSGDPFTPGFRPGVDANGDGSPGNDPAFVDATLPGMSSLLAQWDCLRGQVGRFAQRNACRNPGVHALDLRASFAPARPRGYPIEVVVDALNVLESDTGIRDEALYLVDPTKTLATNPAAGTVTVPLVVNPGFGKILVRRTSGRELRLGLRVNY